MQPPSIDEGIILFYSLENSKILLWQKCNYTQSIKESPISIKYRFLYGIRLLSDLCPLVIGIMSDEERNRLHEGSPFKSIENSRNLAEQTIEIGKMDGFENINEIFLSPNLDESSLFLTCDSFNNVLFTKSFKEEYNSENPEIIRIYDSFLSEINGEKHVELINSIRIQIVYNKVEPVKVMLKNLRKNLIDINNISLFDQYFKKFLMSWEIKKSQITSFNDHSIDFFLIQIMHKIHKKLHQNYFSNQSSKKLINM